MHSVHIGYYYSYLYLKLSGVWESNLGMVLYLRQSQKSIFGLIVQQEQRTMVKGFYIGNMAILSLFHLQDGETDFSTFEISHENNGLIMTARHRHIGLTFKKADNTGPDPVISPFSFEGVWLSPFTKLIVYEIGGWILSVKTGQQFGFTLSTMGSSSSLSMHGLHLFGLSINADEKNSPQDRIHPNMFQIADTEELVEKYLTSEVDVRYSKKSNEIDYDIHEDSLGVIKSVILDVSSTYIPSNLSTFEKCLAGHWTGCIDCMPQENTNYGDVEVHVWPNGLYTFTDAPINDDERGSIGFGYFTPHNNIMLIEWYQIAHPSSVNGTFRPWQYLVMRRNLFQVKLSSHIATGLSSFTSIDPAFNFQINQTKSSSEFVHAGHDYSAIYGLWSDSLGNTFQIYTVKQTVFLQQLEPKNNWLGFCSIAKNYLHGTWLDVTSRESGILILHYTHDSLQWIVPNYPDNINTLTKKK